MEAKIRPTPTVIYFRSVRQGERFATTVPTGYDGLWNGRGAVPRGRVVVGASFAVGRIRHVKALHAGGDTHQSRLDQSPYRNQYRRQRRGRENGKLALREQSTVLVSPGGRQPFRNRARHRTNGNRRGGARQRRLLIRLYAEAHAGRRNLLGIGQRHGEIEDETQPVLCIFNSGVTACFRGR